jgi:hypothetical protein
MTYVLGDLLLDAHCDHFVALKCVAYRLLALKNENVRILELQYFHQLAFQREALKFLIQHNAWRVTSNALGCELLSSIQNVDQYRHNDG